VLRSLPGRRRPGCRVRDTPSVKLALSAADLDVLRLGEGPRVVLVHGSIVDARRTWARQLELAERFTLVIPNRPGFAGSPGLARGDFEAEAPLMAELLGDGAHLVGHSYGGTIALLAAAQRPEAVLSLTVSEPGPVAAHGHPAVDLMIEQGCELYRRRAEIPPRTFVALFRAGAQSARDTPEVLPDWLERGAKLVMEERPVWEAEVPWEKLAQAPFPKLVLSGGHSPAFEAVCDDAAARLGAERDTIAGRGHTVPSTGAPYNARLERFLNA
jgi:pimeloyl-ACP methyl ester carboxylesterase